MKNLLILSVVVVILPLLLVGCDGILGGVGEQNLLDRLEQSRELWQQEGADTYNFTYIRGTLQQEGPETDVFVVHNQIDSVAVNDQAADVEEGLLVEDVFDLVEDAITADSEQFEMSFNNDYGYTERYAIVYRRTGGAESDFFELLSFESDELQDNDSSNDDGDDG